MKAVPYLEHIPGFLEAKQKRKGNQALKLMMQTGLSELQVKEVR